MYCREIETDREIGSPSCRLKGGLIPPPPSGCQSKPNPIIKQGKKKTVYLVYSRTTVVCTIACKCSRPTGAWPGPLKAYNTRHMVGHEFCCIHINAYISCIRINAYGHMATRCVNAVVYSPRTMDIN